MLLAFAGGTLDAFLYLVHGKVFAGAMTGNAVLCGIAILGRNGPDILHDALPIAAALLDASGTVRTVNRAWQRLGSEAGHGGPEVRLGGCYLEVCRDLVYAQAPNVGEPDYLGLKLAPSVDIKPPRLADAPWALECKTWQVINVKDDRQLIIGEGVHFHVRDELWDPKAMRVHMDKYHPIGRMFADRNCRTDDRIVFPAAEGPKWKAAE